MSIFNVVNADLSTEIWGQSGRLSGAGTKIVGIIQWAGLMILVGAVIVKGIKFVSASPDGQAAIKKEIFMLVIGGVLLFAITHIIRIIIDLVQKSGLQ